MAEVTPAARARRLTGAALAACLAVATAAPAGAASGDRALFDEARKARTALEHSSERQAQRAEWERVVLLYRRVLARYPDSRYGDDALVAVGDLYRGMASRFHSPRYAEDAVGAYRSILSEYPKSPLGEQAIYSAFEVALEGSDRDALLDAGTFYLRVFPAAERAQQVKNLMQASPGRASRRPSVGELAVVKNLRSWSGESYTRVVIDLDRQVEVNYDRIGGPDRLWIDLIGAQLDEKLTSRTFPVGDGLLEQVRVGRNREGVVRVVLDYRKVGEHSLFYLEDPARLVVDVHAAPAAPSVLVADARQPEPVVPEDPRRAGAAPPAPEPSAVPVEAAARAEPPPPAPARSAAVPTPAPPPPTPPAVNTSGTYSLARQLGLGARTIVIDPGHGGHDPGSLGHAGLKEKDLVLDVAQRLAVMLRGLGAEVIMTRDSDVFIPLEERTAIANKANSRGADLFLSIHANSSRSRRARGVETYFLNFAADTHAEEVAARENAISEATLKDLQNLVKTITLNSKIYESRDFAGAIQHALVSNLPGTPDRGVRTAPFYVLIGASMPSILAEIAFISHPDEEKRLRSAAYRDEIAQSLFDGVRAYLDQLNRTQTEQLTRRAASPTVGSGEATSR